MNYIELDFADINCLYNTKTIRRDCDNYLDEGILCDKKMAVAMYFKYNKKFKYMECFLNTFNEFVYFKCTPGKVITSDDENELTKKQKGLANYYSKVLFRFFTLCMCGKQYIYISNKKKNIVIKNIDINNTSNVNVIRIMRKIKMYEENKAHRNYKPCEHRIIVKPFFRHLQNGNIIKIESFEKNKNKPLKNGDCIYKLS